MHILLATFVILSLEGTGIAATAIGISWSATGIASNDASLCDSGRAGGGELRRCTGRWEFRGRLGGSC